MTAYYMSCMRLTAADLGEDMLGRELIEYEGVEFRVKSVGMLLGFRASGCF